MNLTPKHFKAIELLYQQAPENYVAEQCGITPATLAKWRADPDFKRALCEVASTQMGELVPLAINKLRELLENGKEQTRMAAIKEVLAFAQLTERKDLESEVTIKVEYV